MPILVFNATDKKPYKWPYPVDPDDIRSFNFVYRPPVWVADSVYIEDRDIVLPVVHNGFGYEVTSGGVAGSVEPTWATVTDDLVTDNSVVYKAVPYTYLLQNGVDITASTWTATAGVTLTNSAFDNQSTSIRADITDNTLTSITLTNHITYGDQELDRSIVVSVKTL